MVHITNTGSKEQKQDYSKKEGAKTVVLYDGKQSVKFNDDGENIAIVNATATGAKSITLGGGGDVVEVYASKGKGTSVNVVGGKGADTVYAAGTAPVTFDMSKGGADKVVLAYDTAKENVTLKGYKAANGGGIQTGAEITEDGNGILDAIQDGSEIKLGNGEITLGEKKANVTFANNNSSKGSTLVNLFGVDANGESVKQAVGFTHEDGGAINVSKNTDDYILVGNWEEEKSAGSTLTGGAGNDTLIGGTGDVLNAGEGKNNRIILNDDSRRDGAEVILNSGYTTVTGANSGYDSEGDVINVNLANAALSVEDDALVVSGSGFGGTISEVAENGIVKQLIKDGGTTYRAMIAGAEDVITVTSDDDDFANYYQGSAIDFTGYEDSVQVDLSSAGAIGSGIQGEAAKFVGFTNLTAGSGRTMFFGGNANETLTAGTGDASLYGAGGRNVLANGTDEKEGTTTFYLMGSADGARNTITGFEFLNQTEDENDNSTTADAINTDGNAVTNVFIRNDNDVAIQVTGSNGATEMALIEGAVGQNFKIGDFVAQVNKTSLTYDGVANYFVATEKNAGISVSADTAKDAIIWLDNPARDGSVYSGDIKTIDASSATVKAELAGNALDNVIAAGSGDASLWGGTGGDDLLIGGAGQNTFFYSGGNGNDTIQGVNDGDVVYLSGFGLEHIVGIDYQSNSVALRLVDGGSVTVNEEGKDVSFVLGDQTFYVNSEHNGFQTEKPSR